MAGSRSSPRLRAPMFLVDRTLGYSVLASWQSEALRFRKVLSGVATGADVVILTGVELQG